jgi:predicted membrane protein
MKMGFLFTGVFWGIVLVLIGLSVILNAILPFNIPFGRIIFALILIYAGISMFTGGNVWGTYKSSSSVIFGETKFEPIQSEETYSAVFGKGDLDLRKLQLKPGANTVEISVIFGGSEVRLPANVPVAVHASSAFGGIRLPDGGSMAFGSRDYTSTGFDANQPHLVLKASTVFGGIEIFRD